MNKKCLTARLLKVKTELARIGSRIEILGATRESLSIIQKEVRGVETSVGELLADATSEKTPMTFSCVAGIKLSILVSPLDEEDVKKGRAYLLEEHAKRHAPSEPCQRWMTKVNRGKGK